MSKEKKENPYKVTLTPYPIDKKQENELLTELAHIFYDLSCQFCKPLLKKATLQKEEHFSSSLTKEA